MNKNEEITRREFVKQSVVGTAVLAGASSGAMAMASPAAASLPNTVVSALGSLLIPSAPGDPGYKDLEQYGITDYVMKNLLGGGREGAGEEPHPAGGGALAEEFNTAARQFFEGQSFLELDEKQREQYLELIVEGSKIADAKLRAQLQSFYRSARTRILTVYYQNFAENEVKRNAQGETILKPGDTHQITNPNTAKIVTGWDIAGFKGPLEWEEEEQRRAMMQKIHTFWFPGDLAKLTPGKTASPPRKTSDGKDYYDVVVVGGGTAGCIVAGRLAERGINPKTGDRLRVAMIEGGDDWSIRDPGIRPGYGYPTRRRMITNLTYEEVGPEGKSAGYEWPFQGENFRLVGGCSVHFGGNTFLPVEEDFHVYRETSGVDWTFGKFWEAREEIKRIYYVTSMPKETWSKGVQLFNEAARGMGFDVEPSPMVRLNCLDCGFCGEGFLCRYDAKGSSLPWAYLGLNNGLKVIANAEAEKILIEKPAGGRPVATGVVYKDKSGALHEVRAARVIVACGAVGTPLLFYKSGYGPRELLGDKLIVENKNVGANLDGDTNSNTIAAFFPEPIYPPRGSTGFTLFTIKPRPWGELNVQMRVPGLARVSGVKYPHQAALSEFAPDHGWKHKEYMRDGRLRSGFITNRLQVLPWKWRVTPDGRMERVSMDEQRIEAVSKEAADLSYAIYEKMSLKPLRVSRRLRAAKSLSPGHNQGSARAGENREVSVCTSDFDCHDIDHLLITSGASMPRTTFGHGLGPIAVGAAYAWRRMLENHFSKGSSTKGYA